jgi:hypothetical protein
MAGLSAATQRQPGARIRALTLIGWVNPVVVRVAEGGARMAARESTEVAFPEGRMTIS